MVLSPVPVTQSKIDDDFYDSLNIVVVLASGYEFFSPKCA